PEAADGDPDRVPVGHGADGARELEQLEGILEGEAVHLLRRLEARELRLFRVVLRAHLHERAVLAVTDADRLARRRILAELTGFRDFLARDRCADVIDLLLELLPETVEHRHPFFL